MKLICTIQVNGVSSQTIFQNTHSKEAWNDASEWMATAWASAHKFPVQSLVFDILEQPDEDNADFMELPY